MTRRIKKTDQDKAWNKKKSITSRNIPYKLPKERFLIICEGEKTEVLYFSSFRVPKEIITIDGLGDNTDSLVERAIEICDKCKKEEGLEFDQRWCVFDKDSFTSQNFNRALQLAQNNGFKVAYSNESFEIWYLLHFHLYVSGLSRDDYKDRLSQHLGREYLKNDSNIFFDLEDKQITGIRNANKLLSDYSSRNNLDPTNNNPSTTVHLLVLELNKYID